MVDDGDVTAVLDGGNGLDHWQAWKAATMAAESPGRRGLTTAAAVGNSGHCGTLGLYLRPMVDAVLMGLVLSNGPAVMPP